jgi:hypothetical protein
VCAAGSPFPDFGSFSIVSPAGFIPAFPPPPATVAHPNPFDFLNWPPPL